MKNLYRTAVVFLIATVVGCASQEPATDCTLTAAELEQVRASAMTYLLEASPALDARCEQMSDRISAVEPGMCAIAGGPSRAPGCAEPSHAGYSIVFERDSLEPQDVYFKTE